jgi:hypothetical protein
MQSTNSASGLAVFLVAQVLLASSFLLGQPGELERSLQGGISADCPSPAQYSSQRPDPAGTPTPVSIAVYFVDILEIKDSEQTFTVDAWLILRWRDTRLADSSRGTAQAFCEANSSQLWIPRTQFRNLRSFDSTSPDFMLIDSAGTLTVFRRGLVTLFSPLDLRDFPFDTQRLTLAVESLYRTDEVEFHPLNDLVGVRDASLTGWLLRPPVASVEIEQGIVQRRPVFNTFIEARREPRFFVRKLLVPVALIVFMAYAVFWVSPSQIAPQTGTATASMLTLIAYEFALSNYLPRISYVTRADFFMLASLVLVFVALTEAIATAGLMNYGKEAAVRRMDWYFRLLYPLAFVVLLLMSIY